jgi:hypothetical protein
MSSRPNGAVETAQSLVPLAPFATRIRLSPTRHMSRVTCHFRLSNAGHSPEENNQNADGNDGERGTSEELRRPIETLAAP